VGIQTRSFLPTIQPNACITVLSIPLPIRRSHSTNGGRDFQPGIPKIVSAGVRQRSAAGRVLTWASPTTQHGNAERNSKSEARNSKQIRMTKIPMTETQRVTRRRAVSSRGRDHHWPHHIKTPATPQGGFGHWELDHWILFRISCFGFRILRGLSSLPHIIRLLVALYRCWTVRHL
jgi:hypothetical protein